MLRSALAGTLAASLFALVAAPSEARACSCAAVEQPEAFAQSASVFEGRVVSTSSADASSLLVVLDVVRTWKGANTERTSVQTASGGAECGYAFEPGASYLVYTYLADDAQERVSLCSRTAPIDDDGARADIAAMGAGVTPVDVSNDQDGEELVPPVSTEPARGGCASCAAGASNRPPAWGLASLVLAALGLALSRGRRS